MGEVIVAYDDILKGAQILEHDIPAISTDELASWHAHNFYSQMMDVCGEIENTKRLKNIFDNSGAPDDFEKLKQSVDKVHKYCCIVRLDEKTSPAKAFDLSMAEWFLRDCMIGQNSFNIDLKNSSDWFDQWLFDINFDLLD